MKKDTLLNQLHDRSNKLKLRIEKIRADAERKVCDLVNEAAKVEAMIALYSPVSNTAGDSPERQGEHLPASVHADASPRDATAAPTDQPTETIPGMFRKKGAAA